MDIVNYHCNHIGIAEVFYFGNLHDGVIEFPATTKDGGVVEVGYYYGDKKRKNIIGISTQIGCPCKCKFCELGDEKFIRNLMPEEMYEQAVSMLQVAYKNGADITLPHKISLAKTGEPLFNTHLRNGLEKMAELGYSFKLSTVFPDAKKCSENFNEAARFAANYIHPVQLQISLLSTSEEQRRELAGIDVASFLTIRKAAEHWKKTVPEARDINLSLIVSDNTICEVNQIKQILPKDLFRFRFRDYMPTDNGKEQKISAVKAERVKEIKDSFKNEGYIVTDDPTPTPTEWKHGLAANVTRKRWIDKNKNQG